MARRNVNNQDEKNIYKSITWLLSGIWLKASFFAYLRPVGAWLANIQ